MFNANGYSTRANANRAIRTNDGTDATHHVFQHHDGRWHVATKDLAPKTKREVTETSIVDSPVRVVWGIVGSMLGARRRDQMAECLRAGVAKFTARTQVQLARTWHNDNTHGWEAVLEG